MFGDRTSGRPLVKICGVTQPEDAALAVSAGADAIGMIFWSGSRRGVSLDVARTIVARIPPDVAKVGVFVNAPAPYINFVASRIGLSLVQLHGDEGPDLLPKLIRPALKAVRSSSAVAPFTDARLAGMVVDGAPDGVYGGAGVRADAETVRAAGRHHRIILAGGLSADNVQEAIRRYRPYAVDVSSGVEADVGIKDPAKVDAFITAVRIAEGEAALA